jgi:hypothetical protein
MNDFDAFDKANVEVRAYDPERSKTLVFQFKTLGLQLPFATALAMGFISLFGHTAAVTQAFRWRHLIKFASFLRVSKMADTTPLPATILKDFAEWLNGFGLGPVTARLIQRTCLLLLSYCERNASHLLSRGTRLVPELAITYSSTPRNALSEDVIKQVLAICHKDIEEIEARLVFGKRLISGDVRNDAERSYALLIAEFLEAGEGDIPSRLELGRAGSNLDRRVQKAGGITSIARTIFLDPESILPFYLSVLIQTSGNTTPILRLRRDCITPHPFRDDLERVVWKKNRAHAEQRIDAPTGRPWSAANLVRKLVVLNEDLVHKCTGSEGDKLFIAYSAKSKEVKVPSDALIYQMLHAFAKRNNIPMFAPSALRRAGAVEHQRVSGSLRAAQHRLNHRSLNTTLLYTNDDAGINDLHDVTIRRFQGLMVQSSLNSLSHSKKSQVATRPELNKSAETVFGFRCLDPFAGIAEGSRPGQLCSQFAKCATCPGALIPLDNVAVVGRLLSARRALEHARERAIREGWMPRYMSIYESTLRVLVDDILPAVSSDISNRALEEIDEKLIPWLE